MAIALIQQQGQTNTLTIPFLSHLSAGKNISTCVDHGKTEDHFDVIVEAGVLRIALLGDNLLPLISDSPADTGVADDDDRDIEENVGEETIAYLTRTVHNITTIN